MRSTIKNSPIFASCAFLFVPALLAQNAVDARAALENAAKSLVRYQPPKAAVPVFVTPAGPCAAALVNVTPPSSSKISVVPPQPTSEMPVVNVPAPACPAK